MRPWLVCVFAIACSSEEIRESPDSSTRWLPSPVPVTDASPIPPIHDAGVDAPIDLEDFHVAGTQVGDVDASNFVKSVTCSFCHASQNTFANMKSAPHDTWSGSLMANAGRDPLFFAQLTTANQDVPGVGSYCLRCHVPMTVVTGHVNDWRGDTIDEVDREGVACHLCHAMIDPKTPFAANDSLALSKLADKPEHYGNAQFVIDPDWLRRGPYQDSGALHPVAEGAPFVKTGEMCGTCHDVGNLAVSKLSNGTYAYNAPHLRAPDPDPIAQFPLERTFTEWKLSAYAQEGTTCQSCHMPVKPGQGCFVGPDRTDLRAHDFAGASAWVLDIIALQYGSKVDVKAIERGKANAALMLKTAAALDLEKQGSSLRVRVTNLSGHKLPTGHIEGRRVFVSVAIDDGKKTLVEYGKWDPLTGDLDEKSTTVFEMHIGLSELAAKATNLPPGPTTHMSLADIIVKDNRIPPRGFVNQTFDAAGAGAVGTKYADGQNHADVAFAIPNGATHAKVTLFYQTVTREYIEALEKGNKSDTWGKTLESLWQQTGKDAPIEMASKEITL